MGKVRLGGKGRAGTGFLLFFALFWSGITSVFDVMLVWNGYRQVRALGYATTEGVVTHSEVKQQAGEDGPTYRADIHYTYRVAEIEHHGDQYRYGMWSSNDRSAHRIVGEHPVGRQVPIYYHPSNPADAVLCVGLQGSDLFLAMFMMPFNLVMVGLWIAIGGGFYHRLARSVAGGARIWDDGLVVRVRLSQIRPLYVAFAAAGGVAFVATFVVGFTAGFSPRMPIMLAVWGLILGAGVLIYVWQRLKLAEGGNDLVIDDLAGTVSLPRGKGRQTDLPVPVRQVIGVEVEQIEKHDSEGGTSYRYAPTLIIAEDDGSTRRERLTEWWDSSQAEGLAAWLQERLRITPRQGDFQP